MIFHKLEKRHRNERLRWNRNRERENWVRNLHEAFFLEHSIEATEAFLFDRLQLCNTYFTNYYYYYFFYNYLVFIYCYLVLFFVWLLWRSGLVEECSYFIGNILVQVRHVFLLDYPVVLSQLKLRGVRAFWNKKKKKIWSKQGKALK